MSHARTATSSQSTSGSTTTVLGQAGACTNADCRTTGSTPFSSSAISGTHTWLVFHERHGGGV